MNSERKAANAVGGKTVRACDSCLRRRPRWFCAADDAFLCQGCDASVHSANQLASRHDRVRLETASFKVKNDLNDHSPPAWHWGFTRKARTPRPNKRSSGQLPAIEDDGDKFMNSNPSPLVPEIRSEEGSQLDETEEQLLYRVPVLEPLSGELCDSSNETGNIQADERRETTLFRSDFNILPRYDGHYHQETACDLDNLQGFLPSETELAEFAADVETLLGTGTGLDEDSSGIELGLGLTDSKDDYEERKVKLEDEEVEAVIACHLDPVWDMAREGFDWNFDYDSPMGLVEEQEQKMVPDSMEAMTNTKYEEMRRKRLLRLNYEEVITAWSSHSQGSPWTTGSRPDCNLDDCWPDFTGMHYSTRMHGPDGSVVGRMGGGDEAREARVLRYREKRRTRLFSKKIRYEVRKLNAEKRPRMKGRFVKRTAFAGGPAFPYLMNK